MLQILGLLIASVLAPWQSYSIPAGSMKPALLPGDVVLALPATENVARGDVIIFVHPVQGVDFIKRVVGLPGDRVQMRGGVLHLNGAPVELIDAGLHVEPYASAGGFGSLPRCDGPPPQTGGDCTKHMQLETFPGDVPHPVLDIGPTTLDDTGEVIVPDGHVFVLGDNRDNSVDSRLGAGAGGPGAVPMANIRARAILVLYSSSGRILQNPANWRNGRLLKVIR